MKEQKYPIYQFEAYWLEKLNPSQYSNTDDLPEGYLRNSTSFYDMFKVPKSDNALDAYLIDWWEKYLRRSGKRTKVKLLRLSHEFIFNESWCLTWFQHWTFDVGQDNADCLASFENYVERIKKYNIENDHFKTEPRFEYSKKRFITLMGAEDRWRWRGAEPDGEPKSESEPPCRCKFCKEQGVLRISH